MKSTNNTTINTLKKGNKESSYSLNIKQIKDFSHVGGRIKEIRESVGASREELAAILDVSVSQYRLLETETSTSVGNFITLLQYLFLTYKINSNYIIQFDNSRIKKEVDSFEDIDIWDKIAIVEKELKTKNKQIKIESIK